MNLNFIKNILQKSNIKDKYIQLLLVNEHLELFFSAFDKNNKYNFMYKELGKISVDKFITYYFLIINSKEVNKEKLLNIFVNNLSIDYNTFFTFLGVLEYVLDNLTRIGVGYAIIYDILKSIVEEEKIEVKKVETVDNKIVENFQNVLYICANDTTSKLKIPKLEKLIVNFLDKSKEINNYYLGDLNMTQDSINKCKIKFGVNDIDLCNFNILFDIIVFEYCPLYPINSKFWTKKSFEDINKILKVNGIIVIPINGPYKGNPKYENIIKIFTENNFNFMEDTGKALIFNQNSIY
jgi:hypothetical protein